MQRRQFLSLSASVAGLNLVPLESIAADVPQYALIIGNDAYAGAAKLSNAGRDALLMQRSLNKLGVNIHLSQNLTALEFDSTVSVFVKRIAAQPSVAWIYYAGHGVQIDGKLWLLGIDATFSSALDVKTKGLNLDRVLGMLESARPLVTVVILDSCRNNPFVPAKAQTRGLPVTGFVPMEPSGVFLAYSTAPYQESQDWPSAANGPYAAALSKALLAKPRRIEDAFTEASQVVYAQTKKLQAPTYTSSLRKEVWLDVSNVSLKPVSGLSINVPSSIAGDGSRGLNQYFRPGVGLELERDNLSNREWEETIARIEQSALNFDQLEIKSLIGRLASPQLSRFDETLAGLIYQKGRQVQKNRGRAIELYERSAGRGYVAAQTLLGELQFERQNYLEAYKWLFEASRVGFSRAKIDLAQLKLLGQGTSKDPAEATRQMGEALQELMRRGQVNSQK